jgi:hypothetical protein
MKINNKIETLKEISGVVFILILFSVGVGMAAFAPVLAVDAEGATRVLKANGFTDIKITGYKWFNGTQDYYNTGFEATGVNGARVSGNVSRGIFLKGSTIRLD